MLKCILQNGIKRKLCLKKQPGHWLDQEKERYPTQLVEDTKTLLKILVLFIPFPIYFALFMQQVLPCPSTGPKIVWLVSNQLIEKIGQAQNLKIILTIFFLYSSFLFIKIYNYMF